MTTSGLLLDEMISRAVACALRDHGVDVVAVTERDDLVRQPDAVILGAAAAEQRVLVTFNIGDFVALDAEWSGQGRAHAGIVLVSAGSFPPNRGLIGALTVALRKVMDSEPPAPGGVTFLKPWSNRQ